MKYFFRLEFWNYHRYTESFKFKKLPDLENQKIMIEIFFKNKNNIELLELRKKYWLTWFELVKDLTETEK